MKLPFGYYIYKTPPYWDALMTLYIGPSKKYTQICVALHKRGIHIHNNAAGQLGPYSLSIHIWWKPIKWLYHCAEYPQASNAESSHSRAENQKP